jgi:RNA polymerase subunit RPABC4/transcription elongation factor Spt4
MISLKLVWVGWVIVIGPTKSQFQIANLLEVDSKP